MPSAFEDAPHGWIADFRGLSGKRRRVRIPGRHCRSKPDADAFARECERYCRILRDQQLDPDPGDVAHALAIKAITPQQAAALSNHRPLIENTRPTLLQAFRAHPSTRHEEKKGGHDPVRHQKAVEDFAARFAIETIDQVRLEHALQWVDEMRRRGLAFDTRRHNLTALRRATHMGTTMGFPDPLARFILDRRERRRPIVVCAPVELVRCALRLRQTDTRALAAIALGGFLGLRPSEMVRARPADLSRGFLAVGARQAKNDPSIRTIPVPPTVQTWLNLRGGELAPDHPYLSPTKQLRSPRNRKRELTYNGLRDWLKPILQRELGHAVTAKILRKTFITWIDSLRVDTEIYERYIGHVSSRMPTITATHYIPRREAEQLAAVSQAIESEITRLSTHPSTSPGEPCIEIACDGT